MSQDVIEKEVDALRSDFERDVQLFLKAYNVDQAPQFEVQPNEAGASPVYLVTGIGMTEYDQEIHGDLDTHEFYESGDENNTRYLMNNTAAILKRLLDDGERVVAHGKDAEVLASVIANHPNRHNVEIIDGTLSDLSIIPTIYEKFAAHSEKAPISNIGMVLYQSFAQGTGSPFKPMHQEQVSEVERASSNRVRFVYNMAAMGYDLLVNKQADDLRIISVSALAANRATYGLIADAADKTMNELLWKTFHLEANISTGKDVTIYQVNPGITTACDVYKNEEARTVVKRESIADGFPMDAAVFSGEQEIPQMSVDAVASVSDSLLRTPYGYNPNESLGDDVKQYFYSGFDPDDFRERFDAAVESHGNTRTINAAGRLPEHAFKPETVHGALPSVIVNGDYKRIALTPPGQKF
jgi:NAD(P)-dependent dehydrogenase (short-subunit alcohol dehydrogenase family)